MRQFILSIFRELVTAKADTIGVERLTVLYLWQIERSPTERGVTCKRVDARGA